MLEVERMIKVFFCGLCKEHERYAMTRLALRKHLADDHWIMSQKFNQQGVDKAKMARQSWIIEEKRE